MTLREIKDNRQHYFVDENHRIQGRYVDYHTNGNVWEECNFVDNNRHGLRRIYHYNGILMWEFFVSNDKEHGECKEYSETGKIISHKIFIDDKPRFLTDDERQELNNISSCEELLAMTLKYGVPLLASLKYGTT